MAEGTPPDVKKNLDQINAQIADGEPDAVVIEGPPPKGKPFIQGEPMQQLALLRSCFSTSPARNGSRFVNQNLKK